MRTRTLTTIAVLVLVTLAASAPWARTVDGTVTLGGTILNQTGDRTAVQEMYNVYDGFAVSRIRLNGLLDPRNSFLLDLREINLDSRRGDFVYRMPGTFKLSAGFDQDRQIFAPDGAVHSQRKDWRVGAQLTPTRWLGLNGAFGYQTRTGDRLSYPLGTASVLGTRYDNALKTGEGTLDLHKGRRGAAVTYRVSDFSDALDSKGDRTGQVVSARLYGPCRFYDKWTHVLRASYGERKLSNRDLDYKLTDVRYTGIIEPVETFRLRYDFDGSRVDDQSTKLKTDRFVNEFDAAWLHRYGQINAGYGYETNDDDRTLTSYNSWHAGAAFHHGKVATAKVDYASRVKKDQEELTLLKDVEASQIRARLDLRPWDEITIGAAFAKREREFPDIHVDLKGDVLDVIGRYDWKGWGAVSGDYSYATDDFQDLAGGFRTRSQIVSGRVEVTRIRDVQLAGGVTYLDIGRDLDIEKLVGSAEGSWRFAKDYHLEVAYNVYNYDDYVLLDRYYTANVLRLGLGYDLHLK